MANFMAYLKNSGAFDDVQLDQFYQDDTHERLTYKFSLSCQFKSPTGGPSPTSGAAPDGSCRRPWVGSGDRTGRNRTPGAGRPARRSPRQGRSKRLLGRRG